MNPSSNSIQKTEGRLDAIDQYRGFAIVLMVLADYLSRVELVPPWLKHAPGTGLTVVDLIGPFFILTIGLTFKPSWTDRGGSFHCNYPHGIEKSYE